MADLEIPFAIVERKGVFGIHLAYRAKVVILGRRYAGTGRHRTPQG